MSSVHLGDAGVCAVQVLEELDVSHIPMISVWNKVDVCADPRHGTDCR